MHRRNLWLLILALIVFAGCAGMRGEHPKAAAEHSAK